MAKYLVEFYVKGTDTTGKKCKFSENYDIIASEKDIVDTFKYFFESKEPDVGAYIFPLEVVTLEVERKIVITGNPNGAFCDNAVNEALNNTLNEIKKVGKVDGHLPANEEDRQSDSEDRQSDSEDHQSDSEDYQSNAEDCQ